MAKFVSKALSYNSNECAPVALALQVAALDAEEKGYYRTACNNYLFSERAWVADNSPANADQMRHAADRCLKAVYKAMSKA